MPPRPAATIEEFKNALQIEKVKMWESEKVVEICRRKGMSFKETMKAAFPVRRELNNVTKIEQALIIYDGNAALPYCDLVYEALRFYQRYMADNGKTSQTERCQGNVE